MKQLLNISRKANGFEYDFSYQLDSVNQFIFRASIEGTIEKVQLENISSITIKQTGPAGQVIYNGTQSSFFLEEEKTYILSIVKVNPSLNASVKLIAINYPEKTVSKILVTLPTNVGNFAATVNRGSNTYTVLQRSGNTYSIVGHYILPAGYTAGTVCYNKNRNAFLFITRDTTVNGKWVCSIVSLTDPTYSMTDLSGTSGQFSPLFQRTNYNTIYGKPSYLSKINVLVVQIQGQVFMLTEDLVNNTFTDINKGLAIPSSAYINDIFYESAYDRIFAGHRNLYDGVNGYGDRVGAKHQFYINTDLYIWPLYINGSGLGIVDSNINSIDGSFGPGNANYRVYSYCSQIQNYYVGMGSLIWDLLNNSEPSIELVFYSKSNLQDKTYYRLPISNFTTDLQCGLADLKGIPGTDLIVGRIFCSSIATANADTAKMIVFDCSRLLSSGQSNANPIQTGTGVNEISFNIIDLSNGGVNDALADISTNNIYLRMNGILAIDYENE